MKGIFPYLITAFIFLVAIVFTDGAFWADTPDYVDSVIARRDGISYHFWEFGHLLWRPLGWLTWSAFFSSSDPANWRYEVNSVFRAITIFSGLITVLLMTAIFRRMELKSPAIVLLIALFVFSHAFLNFTQTGTSYITALMFYTLGLYLASGEETDKLRLIVCGTSFAMSVAFWVPYLFAVPAALFADSFFFGANRQRVREAFGRGIVFAAAAAGIFLGGAAARGVNSLGGLAAWIAEASHGNDTTGFARAAFGFARSFVNVGSLGIEVKRILFGDPYSASTFRSLISIELAILFGFFVFGSLVIYLLLTDRIVRPFALFLIAAVTPMFLFAVFFDGGAVERFLPVYPAVFIAIAAAVRITRLPAAKIAIGTLACLFIASGYQALSNTTLAKATVGPETRMKSFEGRATPDDTIYVVNWLDDLINFNRSFPFNESVRKGNYRITALVTPGLRDAGHWRETFAERCFLAWQKGSSVWLSSRAFAERPAPEWAWVEGVDTRTAWSEFPAFFEQLEFGDRLGEPDGFVLVEPNEKNRIVLEPYRQAFTGKILY